MRGSVWLVSKFAMSVSSKTRLCRPLMAMTVLSPRRDDRQTLKVASERRLPGSSYRELYAHERGTADNRWSGTERQISTIEHHRRFADVGVGIRSTDGSYESRLGDLATIALGVAPLTAFCPG